MTSTVWCLAVLGGLVLVLAITPRSPKENFGNVLGAAGEYKTQYNRCVRACERSDPRQRLSQNPWACGMYCDSTISRNVEQGRAAPHFVDNLAVCKQQCGSDATCQDECACRYDVFYYCSQDCNYSDDPSCIPQCTAIHDERCVAGATV